MVDNDYPPGREGLTWCKCGWGFYIAKNNKKQCRCGRTYQRGNRMTVTEVQETNKGGKEQW